VSPASEREARRVAEAARESEWARPSFAKGIFLGDFDLDLVHPHPQPTDEARSAGERFLMALEAFLRDEVDPLAIEREARIPDTVVKGLKALGAFGMKIEPRYGGLGLSHLYYNRALALAGSAHASLSSLLSAHQSIGVPEPLHLFGTEAQKEQFLPRVARDDISAFLLTEPDVGSDPARMASTAVPTPDGSSYVINGTKLWTTNGVIADLLVVMAVVPEAGDEPGGITAFVVEAASPGITVQHRNQFMGLRGIENGVTRFDNVMVPATNVIGGVGKGLRVALTTLNTGRLSLPAICAGSAKMSLRIARTWAGERVQWGRPIGTHEAVAHKIAFMAGLTFAMEAVVDLSGLLADQGSHDIRLEAALAKLYCSEMAWRVADDMVQIRGGRGYETAESLRARGEPAIPAEQILRDLRITRIFEGSSEIMKLLIAREAVDQHLSVAGDLIDPEAKPSSKARAALAATRFYARWLPSLVRRRPRRDYAKFGEPLGAHLRFVEQSSRRLARATFYGMARWRGGLERKQGFLGRIVDIGAELYAMSAACVRARMLVVAEQDGEAAVELADAFCSGARRRVGQLFHELWRNDDEDNYALAQAVLEGRYAWCELGVLDPALLGDATSAAEVHGRTASPAG
jgi:hypothetical protein